MMKAKQKLIKNRILVKTSKVLKRESKILQEQKISMRLELKRKANSLKEIEKERRERIERRNLLKELEKQNH